MDEGESGSSQSIPSNYTDFHLLSKSVERNEGCLPEEGFFMGGSRSHSQIRKHRKIKKRDDNRKKKKIRKYNYLFKTVNVHLKKVVHKKVKSAYVLQLFDNEYENLKDNLGKFACLVELLRLMKNLKIVQISWQGYLKQKITQYQSSESQNPQKIQKMKKLFEATKVAISKDYYHQVLAAFWGKRKRSQKFDLQIEKIESKIWEYKTYAMYLRI